MKIALLQLNSGSNKKKNINKALRFTLEAVRNKAQFILLPEVFNYRGKISANSLSRSIAETILGESSIPFMLLARAHKVFILLGSLYERIEGTKKVYNTSVLINKEGKIQARYRKINLFDAVIGQTAVKESQFFKAGKKPVLTHAGEFNIGLSICYDLRFPGFYRHYAQKNAQILCAPSSFTKITGQAHWEVLLRARAIENLSYVLAPNQVGVGSRGIASYGNSMVVDPWGRVLARASAQKEEIIYARITLDEIKKAESRLPSIK